MNNIQSIMNCHECYHKYQQKIMFHCNFKRQLTNLIFRLHYRQTLTGCDYIFVENCTFSNSLHLYGTSLIKRNALSCIWRNLSIFRKYKEGYLCFNSVYGFAIWTTILTKFTEIHNQMDAGIDNKKAKQTEQNQCTVKAFARGQHTYWPVINC